MSRGSPSVTFMRSAMIRIIASDGPLAENGTMTVIGCDGKFSASALPPNVSIASAARTILRIQLSLGPAARKLQLRVVDRLMAIERARDRRQRVFKPCRAIEQQPPIIFRDAAVGETLFVGGIGCGALRAQQQAFFARDFVQRSRNFLIRHRDGKTLALADGAEDKKIPDRLRHADAGGDGV